MFRRASALTVAGCLVFGLGCGGEEEDQTAQDNPSKSANEVDTPRRAGGGTEPAPDFVAVLETLPVYPGAILADDIYPNGSATGANLRIGYLSEDPTLEVASFYSTELMNEGWALVGSRELGPADEKKDDIDSALIDIRSFSQNGYQVTVSVSSASKDILRPTGISVEIEFLQPPQPSG